MVEFYSVWFTTKCSSNEMQLIAAFCIIFQIMELDLSLFFFRCSVSHGNQSEQPAVSWLRICRNYVNGITYAFFSYSSIWKHMYSMCWNSSLFLHWKHSESLCVYKNHVWCRVLIFVVVVGNCCIVNGLVLLRKKLFAHWWTSLMCVRKTSYQITTIEHRWSS